MNNIQQSNPIQEKIVKFFQELSNEILFDIEAKKNEHANKNAVLLKAIKENTLKLEELERQIADSKKKNLNFKKETKDLEKEFDNIQNKLVEDIERIEKTKLDLGKEVDILVQKYNNLVRELQNKQVLISNLDDKITKKNKEKSGLEEQISELKLDWNTKSLLSQNELNNLQLTTSKLREFIKQQKAELEGIENSITEGVEKIAKISKIIEETNKEKNELESVVKELQVRKDTELAELLDEQSKLRSEILKEKKDFEKEKNYIENAKTVIDTKQKAITLIVEDLTKKISQILVMEDISEKNKNILKNVLSQLSKQI